MTYRKSMSDAIREVQESTIKPYVSMSMGGQYNVLDKDSKVVYSTKDKTLAYDYFKKNFDKLKEELQEASAEQIAKKAQELGVSATATSKGISVSSFNNDPRPAATLGPKCAI